MAGVKRSRSRVKNFFFTNHNLTRVAIFYLIVTGTLSLPKPLYDGTPIIHPPNKKTGFIDPNNFVWNKDFNFIMKLKGSPESNFFKKSTDSLEDYKYQPISKASANNIEANAMDEWSSAKGSNGTLLASGSMQLAKIINDTLISKWSNATGTEGWLSVCQIPIIVTVTGVLAVLVVTFFVVLWFKRQLRNADKVENVYELSDSTEENPGEDQPMTGINPPNPMRDSQEPGPSQPEIELKGYAGVVTQEAEPVRQQDKLTELMAKSGKEANEKPEGKKDKAGKGLLERRGSFASLTIGVPMSSFERQYNYLLPQEDNTDEYLLTSTNLLTLSELAASLKNTQALHAEFWDIPLNHPERIEVSLSGTKNRYETIMPNDRTRVKLDIVSYNPLDSYINANYIRGFEGEEKAYIATQGPLDNTIVDLYHMIWKEKSPAIVMITKLLEKGKRKCEAYFPLGEGESMEFGEYKITTMSVTPKAGYTVRELVIQKNKDRRLVLHYWLDTWADHDIPDDADTILTLATEVEEFRLAVKNSAYPYDAKKYSLDFAPIIVHCSAGIGRTGCFIGITIGMNQLKKENKVDVLGIVCQMRYDRGGMVQTGEQYEFVHKALYVFAQNLPGPSKN